MNVRSASKSYTMDYKTSFIGGMSMGEINLKYPILMVHGMGFRDRKYLNYWGRIPGTLEKAGCNGGVIKYTAF